MHPPVDVYLAHCREDSGWATRLSQYLRETGLSSFQHEFVVPGAVLVHEIDRALSAAPAAVVVVSRHSLGGAGPREYAALTELADAGRLVLVPVLVDGSPPPPMLATRTALDFSAAQSDADWTALVALLAAALRGSPVVRRSTGPIDFDRIAEGPIAVTVTVDARSVTLTGPDGESVCRPHPGMPSALTALLDDHDRVRRGADRRLREGREPGRPAGPSIVDIGEAIGRDFLGAPVSTALSRLVATADRRNVALHLAFDLDQAPQPLADVPWESTIVPGMFTPLVLLPRVRVYRQADLGPTVQPPIPGPLRILAVIASPDHGGGELLDYEHELGMILDQVEGARRGDAHVTVLNWGSVEAIGEALRLERFHIMHISCHAEPGRLMLETPDGQPNPVDPAIFVRDLVLPDRGVPLVVLAGCYTARTVADRHVLPGFARTLLEHGVPAVLAMTSAVDDLYCTDLLARTYGALARASDRTDPIVALSDTRRELEAERLRLPAADPRAAVLDWPVPALFTRVRRPVLFDPAQQPAEVLRKRPIQVAAEIVDLDPGEFVGRRTELRLLLRALNGGEHRGVVIHGIGGVGKSSLAVQLVRMLEGDRRTVISLHGRRGVAQILRAIAWHLRHGPLHAEAATLAKDLVADEDDDDDWLAHRLALIEGFVRQHRWELVLLLDDPVGDPLAESVSVGTAAVDAEVPLDAQVDAFIERWLRIRHNVRLIATVRHATTIRGRHLMHHHLGPLSWAETRKMIWRLPAVYALSAAEQRRAYEDLGGHPRALEYLDALLRGARRVVPAEGARSGNRPFADITARLEQAYRQRGIGDVASRWTAAAGDLGKAIAETVAAASADVLLDRLFIRLMGTFPLAAELLVKAAVFRQPVDEIGLGWVVALDEEPTDPARRERMGVAYDALRSLRADDPKATLDDLAGATRVRTDLAGGGRPAPRAGLLAARERLLDLTLLAPAGEDRFIVHRWTARALAEVADRDDARQAHLRAVQYWRWRARIYQDDDHDADLEEARYHCLVVGDHAQLIEVSADLCAALYRRGAFDRIRQVCRETLDKIGDQVPEARAFLHTLGTVEMWRGRYELAGRHLEQCLQLARSDRDVLAEAATYQQLGTIAQLQRREKDAGRLLQEEAAARCWRPDLDHRPAAWLVTAACYQQLGAMALEKGDADAWRWSDGARQAAGDVLHAAALARGELDLARLAREAGEHGRAEEHEQRAREATTAAPEARWLLAASTLQLGSAKLLQGDLEVAGKELAGAVEAARDLSDVPLFAQCLRLLGDVLFEVGHHVRAEAVYQEMAELAEALDDPTGQVVAWQQLGRISSARGAAEAADRRLRKALALATEFRQNRLIAATNLFLADAALRRGEPAAAEDFLREAMELAQAADAHAVWIAAATQRAVVAAVTRDLPGAEHWFNQALERADELPNPAAVATCCVALGLLSREQRRNDAAAGWFRRAERVATASGNVRITAGCRLHLSRIALERSDLGESERLLRSVLTLLDRRTHLDLTTEAWCALGRNLAGRPVPDVAEAVAAWEQGLAGCRTLGSTDRAVWCLVHLAGLHRYAGDDDAMATALEEAGTLALRLTASPLRVVGLLAGGAQALDRDDLNAAAAAFGAALVAATQCQPEQVSLEVECHRHLGATARRRALDAADTRVQHLRDATMHHRQATTLTDRLSDQIGAMHDWRSLGQVLLESGNAAEARDAFRRSGGLALALNNPPAHGVAELLLAEVETIAGDEAAATRHRGRAAGLLGAAMPGGAGRVEGTVVFGRVAGRWDDIRWIRRLDCLDGERLFTEPMAVYLGPSVEEVVQAMTPRRSMISGVPTVVWPHRLGRPGRAPAS